MPVHPRIAGILGEIGGNVYSSLARRLQTFSGEAYPLHVGDTWLEPAPGCRMEDLKVDECPGLHRYAPPEGRGELLDSIVERITRRTGVPTERGDVLVSTGATGALGAVMGSILDPGDEVLILAPYWPLIPGIVRCFRGHPVVVPFLGVVDSPESAVRAVEAAIGPRTVALYLSTPNNPTGALLPADWLESLVAWARRRELWIVADDVYEDYVFRGEHTPCRALAPERTFSAHSFSKAFGMAGNRCGYVIGPGEAMDSLRKVSTHSWYSTPTSAQIAGHRALDGRGDAWIDDVRPRYRQAGERAAARLGLDAPAGSTFLFVDVADRLDERGLAGFLERCADRGLFVAPGPSFGPYPGHVRLCYTSAEPAVVQRGVEILADLLGR